MKHTPAPWIADIGNEGSFDIGADGHGFAGGMLVVCSRKPHAGLVDQMEANARLIAAAPELLEALIEFEAMAHEFDLDGDRQIAAFERAQAAISKATGEQP